MIVSCIYDMANDIKQVTAALKTSGQISLQLDEMADVNDAAQLMAYVRYSGQTNMEVGKSFGLVLPVTYYDYLWSQSS